MDSNTQQQLRNWCGECQKSLAGKRALADHRRSIHGEGPMQFCPTCNKPFKDSANYRRHTSKCSGRGPVFVCEYCHYQGTRSDNLKRHCKSHGDAVGAVHRKLDRAAVDAWKSHHPPKNQEIQQQQQLVAEEMLEEEQEQQPAAFEAPVTCSLPQLDLGRSGCSSAWQVQAMPTNQGQVAAVQGVPQYLPPPQEMREARQELPVRREVFLSVQEPATTILGAWEPTSVGGSEQSGNSDKGLAVWDMGGFVYDDPLSGVDGLEDFRLDAGVF